MHFLNDGRLSSEGGLREAMGFDGSKKTNKCQYALAHSSEDGKACPASDVDLSARLNSSRRKWGGITALFVWLLSLL